MTNAQTLADKAYELGTKYQFTYRGCSQTVLAALQDATGIKNDAVFKAATGLSAGGGLCNDGSCGAYAGAILFIGMVIGRERQDFTDAAKIRMRTFALSRKLHDRFVAEYGTMICRDIHRKLMGRAYVMADPDEMKKFDDAGGHSTVAPEVVGKAARWTVEILAEEGLLSR
jgi:C_GCAxxG_C_C family probable redox protein